MRTRDIVASAAYAFAAALAVGCYSLQPPVDPQHILDLRSQSEGGTALDAPIGLIGPSCYTPRYPEELRLARVGGTVVLLLTIDTQGRVVPPIRLDSTTDHRLDAYAASVVRTCRFRPGVLHGQAQRGLAWLPVTSRVLDSGDVDIAFGPPH